MMSVDINTIIPGKVNLITNVFSKDTIENLYNYVYWNNGDMEFDENYTCSGKKALDKTIFNSLWLTLNKYPIISSSDYDEKTPVEIRYCAPHSKNFRLSFGTNRVLIFLNNVSTGGDIRIYKDKLNYIDITPVQGNILSIDNSTRIRELEILSNISKYFIQISFSKNENETKLEIIKVSEIGTKNTFSHVPNSNRLKYKQAQLMINGEVKLLNSDSTDSFSNYRWREVISRTRIFNIERCIVDSNIDTIRGRPPTNFEDYCPNCYEILPILNEYKNCSGCCSPVTSINHKLRNSILNG